MQIGEFLKQEDIEKCRKIAKKTEWRKKRAAKSNARKVSSQFVKFCAASC